MCVPKLVRVPVEACGEQMASPRGTFPYSQTDTDDLKTSKKKHTKNASFCVTSALGDRILLSSARQARFAEVSPQDLIGLKIKTSLLMC